MGWVGSHAGDYRGRWAPTQTGSVCHPAFAHSGGSSARRTRVSGESGRQTALFRHQPGGRRCMPLDAGPSESHSASAS